MSMGGISLGDAILYFKGDTSQLSSASSAAESIVTQAGNNMKTNYLAMGAAATAAFGGMSLALNGLTAGARESEVINTQIEQTIKSTGGAAGMTAKQVESLASELKEQTAISGGAIKAGEAMLLTFTNIGKDTFPTATKAMLDMATSMNGGAAPSAEALRGTAIQLGKALNDPIAGLTALSRVGVAFSEDQKNTIKTMVDMGNTAGAQQVILAELNKEFGGSAAARIETTNGKMELFSMHVKAATASIGELLLPITPMVDGVSKAGFAISGLGTAAATFRPLLTAAGTAIGLMGTNSAAAATSITATCTSSAAATIGVMGLATSFGAAALAAAPFILVLGVAVGAIMLQYDAAKKNAEAQKENAEAQKGLQTETQKLMVLAEKRNIQLDQTAMKTMDEGDKMEYVRQAIERDIAAKKDQAEAVKQAEFEKRGAWADSESTQKSLMEAEAQTMDDWWTHYDMAMKGQDGWVMGTTGNLVQITQTAIQTTAQMTQGMGNSVNTYMNGLFKNIEEYKRGLSDFFNAMFSSDEKLQAQINQQVNNTINQANNQGNGAVIGMGSQAATMGKASGAGQSSPQGVNININGLTVNGTTVDAAIAKLGEMINDELAANGMKFSKA